MTYLELEKICANWNGEVCLFGAGKIGKGWAYDLIKAAGIKIDFYCDNNIKTNSVIKDGLRVRDIQYIYNNIDSVIVFVTVGIRFQEDMVNQLKEHGVSKIVIADNVFLSDILESIVDSNDEIVKKKYHAVYDNVEYIVNQFKLYTGYVIDLNNPKTFNEKLQWLKLHNHKPEYVQMVDKYGMKAFVRNKIGEGYTIPTLGVWDSFDEIDFKNLPNKFVLKCTHDSGSIVIVDDKDRLNKKQAKKILDTALKVNYYWLGREWPYRGVGKQIIAEELIGSLDGEQYIRDYKVFTFEGIPKIIMTVVGGHFQESKIIRRMYDVSWNLLDVGLHGKEAEKNPEDKPSQLDEMLEIARKLSEGTKHLRVDFYIHEGKILVGELTFFHQGGMEIFNPNSYNLLFGSWISLD